MPSLSRHVQWGAGTLTRNCHRSWGNSTIPLVPALFGKLVAQELSGKEELVWRRCPVPGIQLSGVMWERWTTVILSLDARQPASAGKGWIRCQRRPARCIIEPIISAVLLSKRNFGCSRCVGAEGIPCGSVACSCCELKRVAGLHWGGHGNTWKRLISFVWVINSPLHEITQAHKF